MKNKTKIIVMGGMYVAIYATFFLVSNYTGGILESMLFFILPIPLCLFTFQYGFKYALIPYFAIALIGYFINPISTLVYVLTANIVGIIYGILLRNKAKSRTRLLVCILAAIFTDLLSSVIFAKLLNYSLTEEIYEIFNFFMSLFKITNFDPLVMDRIIYATMPLFVIIMGVVEGFITHIFICFIMNRLKFTNVSIGNIYLLCLPKTSAFLGTFSYLFRILTIDWFYHSDGFKYVLGIISFEFFYLINFVLAIQGFISTILWISRKGKIKYLYLIFNFIFIIIAPVGLMLLYSIVAIILIFSDKHKHLLYNNKYL